MSDAVLMQLLQVLADGRYHSGEELGERLSMSRTAVWKQLKKLPELGVQLQSGRGQGYCLPGGLELFERARIIQEAAPWCGDLLLELVVDSTNARLMARPSALGSGAVCIAEQQTAGRGRRGRTWISPFGQNLYLSMLWQFEGGASALEGLSLAVGVCVAEVLESFGLADVQLKWPNDVLANDRKLAGVLLEMTGDPSGTCQVVVGVGVNWRMPEEAAQSIDQPWVDIARLAEEQGAQPVSRNALAGRLIASLSSMLEDFVAGGFSGWRQRWLHRAAFIGQLVELSTANRRCAGMLLGVDDAGALLLDVDGEPQRFYGGEVSLRSAS
ncbi:bifunctional biotin--[acetyl-CoA-carboxylase] ligase/biotin operon repressor BirA [Gilvimarinus sp. DA14]|uniref:bifunctional biotin--[acetyl-CoA-carboxylase] ligase/biotin operon repressor BirA n=1 Tax=Gilvimarinus sp. DA14 TaxID=2956798 RepID=UPI0020B77493|nr:bifunctional biotin--[acetyl-CoA-carboxylase] ligase/biotin operon repressor BirA [Gilvimarinus sp. DA14]UTF59418.1 bifunctional biotin--[acetyl-CoA-carboxylase] ligase/biotin operon repressor BirA [Gilvimarinus sp. DA14]